MHELGVVFHVIKQINELAVENKVDKINSVTLQLGEVSTVLPDYLEDCWNWAVKKETVLKDAKLVIERISAVTICNSCEKTYGTVEHGKKCPYCGSDDTYLLTGNEFIIKEVEAVDS